MRKIDTVLITVIVATAIVAISTAYQSYCSWHILYQTENSPCMQKWKRTTDEEAARDNERARARATLRKIIEEATEEQ